MVWRSMISLHPPGFGTKKALETQREETTGPADILSKKTGLVAGKLLT